jgi:hypothetical protein
MKQILSTLILLFTLVVNAQDDAPISKEAFYGTWRACGDVNFDEEADTLVFQRDNLACIDNNCGENDWSFRESGTVEFIFTDGCENGFHSKSKNPKRWMYIQKDNMLKFINNYGYKEYFQVLELKERLVLVHRMDLEE